jgi:hypothetical protein
MGLRDDKECISFSEYADFAVDRVHEQIGVT